VVLGNSREMSHNVLSPHHLLRGFAVNRKEWPTTGIRLENLRLFIQEKYRFRLVHYTIKILNDLFKISLLVYYRLIYIKVWGPGIDRWLPIPTTSTVQSPVTVSILSGDTRVAALIDHDRRGWNVALIKEIFNAEEAKVITNIPLSPSPATTRPADLG